MNRLATTGGVAVAGLVVVAAVAPKIIAVSHALVPLLIVLGLVVIGVRLAFFHTRRW